MAALKSKIDIDFIRAQGETSRGRIWFQPVRQPIGTSMLSDAAVPADVISGRGSIDLVRLPVGTYRVVEQIDERPDRTYYFSLPVDAPEVVQYESIVPVVTAPVVHQYVSKINGISPDPTTGNIELEAIEGPVGPKGDKGDDGAPSTVPGPKGDKGDDGADSTVPGPKGDPGEPGRDGVLKDYATTGLFTGSLFLAGDSGDWMICPPAYHTENVAVAGDKILWTPQLFQQTDQQAAYDLASIVNGEIVRRKSTGTAAASEYGFGGFYTAATHGRGLRPAWWVVEEADIDDGVVTLAILYRNSGSGNTIGHAAVPSEIVSVNVGQGVLPL